MKSLFYISNRFSLILSQQKYYEYKASTDVSILLFEIKSISISNRNHVCT